MNCHCRQPWFGMCDISSRLESLFLLQRSTTYFLHTRLRYKTDNWSPDVKRHEESIHQASYRPPITTPLKKEQYVTSILAIFDSKAGIHRLLVPALILELVWGLFKLTLNPDQLLVTTEGLNWHFTMHSSASPRPLTARVSRYSVFTFPGSSINSKRQCDARLEFIGQVKTIW